MGKIVDRIQKIASTERITIGALERRIGASKGVLSRAINNGTDIQAKWLEVIVENFPQYSTRWLLTGVGDMLKPSTAPTVNAAPAPKDGDGGNHARGVSAMEKALDEIAEMRKLLAESIRNNREQADRLLSIIEKMQGK